jgi:hypothetical protein
VKRTNQFKQLALAMHNYHSAKKHFPASAAIRDAEGKPLFSWRVALLPWLEQRELYHQFHFDEPWDSPHNRGLIKRMPDVYYDPSQPRLGREGKTTYQVPLGIETAFLPIGQSDYYPENANVGGVFVGRGITFRDLTDGTSNTIMLVDIAPSEAVIWTKPDDWEVDLADPHRGLRADGIKNFVAARCDGSVHLESMDISTEALRAMLTRASGDVAN